MKFIQNLIDRYRHQLQSQNDSCNFLISRIDDALRDASLILSSTESFIDSSAEVLWHNQYHSLIIDAEPSNIKKFKKTSQYNTLCSKQSELFDTVRSLSHRIRQHNDRILSTKVQSARLLIGNVEGRELDQQQLACIVKEYHNHLVIAGAGTGKTTTIVGKVKYLLKSSTCSPEDILVLSFTNASASEIRARLSAETGHSISALTFHKLGLNIISQVDGIVPKITKIDLRQFVKENLILNLQSEFYLNLLNSYLLYHRLPEKSEFDFNSQAEYDEYLSLNPPTTVNNEIVKSYGEMDIANFLMQNSIRYIYEQPYEIDTRTSEHGQYHPDFYLPDYEIYIEYFGIDRSGQVPAYFNSKDGMSASETYRESMKWKRSIHHTYQTTLVECYAYEKTEGRLLDNLKLKLESLSVVLCPKSSKELWSEVSSIGETSLTSIIELFETLINLMKSNGYDISTVRSLNHPSKTYQANNIILDLLKPIFDAYCQYLLDHHEIDFNDMINLASTYVYQGKYTNPYKYVIVDEYQDISKARFTLLKQLRISNDYTLFCVGDDWQSIYRFAGSDIGFLLDFSNYWGASEISKIETTYRFSQNLVDISSNFIMQNPLQIKKRIQGNYDSNVPFRELSGYNEQISIILISKALQNLPEGSSVFFIGRYSFDAKPLASSELFSCQHNNKTGFLDVISSSRPDLKITFMTVHKSKGLQADYVFIINNKKSKLGFPSKIENAPILDLLLDHSDSYPYSEERRLFYVALTRAKKKVFIVTVSGQESEFVIELRNQFGRTMECSQLECPRCGGQLVIRSGPYSKFLGCSNYRSHGCTYRRKLS